MADKIYAYNTHYEIVDYNLGDFPRLELDLSLWDDIYYTTIPKYYYDEEKRVLYIPRGYDPTKLEEWAKKPITIVNRCTTKRKMFYPISTPPRDMQQKEAIRFLLGNNEYEEMRGASQLVLSLPTSWGKTYCTIAALSLYGYKAMIIVRTKTLADQWKEKFSEYCDDIEPDAIHIIKSGEIDKLMKKKQKELAYTQVYITTHDMLRNYMKKNGLTALSDVMEKLGIGVKVIDEAHEEYSNTLMMDYATNVWKTIYLTATFARSADTDNHIFQNSFNMVYKLVKSATTKRKHVHYIPIIYRTIPSLDDMIAVKGVKGFDRFAYIDYELENEKLVGSIAFILDLLVTKKQMKGKIAILSAKIDSCNFFCKQMKVMYPDKKVCAHYTGNKEEHYKDFDIICATPKMIGTGEDIPGLRILINTDPTSSQVITTQVFGRLREYSPEEDTYYIEPFDKAFPNTTAMYKKREVVLKVLAKDILKIDTTIKRR